MSGVSTSRETPRDSRLPLPTPIVDAYTVVPITRGRRDAPGTPLSYSRWYPKNFRSLTTFSYLTNTVMRRREPLPLLFASFL